MENRGQWARMHTHEEAVYTQVTGRKGWIFGDQWAFQGTQLANEGSARGGGPVQDSILSQEGLCGMFSNGSVPPYLAERPDSFMVCESGPGEAVFWPGLCDGECGWWHGTCGLDTWNCGFTHIGYRNETEDLALKHRQDN